MTLLFFESLEKWQDATIFKGVKPLVTSYSIIKKLTVQYTPPSGFCQIREISRRFRFVT